MKILLTRRPAPPGWQFIIETLFVMKISTCLLLVTVFQAAAKESKGQILNLDVRQATVRQVFQKITAETGYYFIYSEDQIAGLPPVTIQVKNASLESVLDICFRNQPLDYSIDREIKQVVIRSQPFQGAPLPPAQAGGSVEGTVYNENGEPLQGASITVKGTKMMAETNGKGQFVLHDIPDNAVLLVTYVGYNSREIPVSDLHNGKLTLTPRVGQLDETMIVAYGTTTARFNVGSVSKVSSADIEAQPVLNPLDALEGRVPGLQVTPTSGVPGSTTLVQIRGQNTLNGTGGFPSPVDNPLFIIDGVPFTAQNNNLNQYTSVAAPGVAAQFNNSYGGMSPFSSLNPADIESVEVLRDADATAIYGSRGANGVILITTKHGKPGKTKFSANVWTGESHIEKTVPMLNTAQYLQVRHEGLNNDGATPNTGNAPDLVVFDTTKYTDWTRYFLGSSSHTTDANASLSGGSANTQFLFGAGYHHEGYIYPGDFGFDRASVNTNYHHTSTDQRFVFDFSANYSYTQNNLSANPGAIIAYLLPPDNPALLNPNGSIVWNYKGVDIGNNPIGYLSEKYKMQNTNLLSHLQMSYELLSGLYVRSSFGYNSLNSTETSLDPISAQDPLYGPSGSANFGTNNLQTWIIEPQAEYKKNVLGGRLDVLFGATFQQNVGKTTNIAASGYTNDALLESVSAAGHTQAFDGYSLYKYSAGFGRINYIWDNEFILSLNARRDGSSRFGPGQQFGNFGSAGAGWIFTEEKAVRNAIPVLSFGKLRASYGTTGNDNVGDYQYIANWQPISVAFQGSNGYLPTNLYQPYYSWETNKKLEGGIELGFLKDRVLASATYYRNRCGDQLVSYALPIQAGFSSVTKNLPAVVQNSGLEIQLSSSIFKTKNFFWNAGFNLSIPRNKLLSFPGLATSSYAYSYVVGKSLSVIQAYKSAGVNDTTGVFQFYTSKGATTYYPDLTKDRVVIGNFDAKYLGSLINTFSYKGLSLTVFFEFQKQYGHNYLFSLYGGQLPGSLSNQPSAILGHYWKNPGDNQPLQRLTSGSNFPAFLGGSNFIQSDAVYGNSSFARCKNVSLSYRINNSYLKHIGMGSCMIYANAQNLFTISNYKLGDPQTQSLYSLPPLRTIVVGIQFTY